MEDIFLENVFSTNQVDIHPNDVHKAQMLFNNHYGVNVGSDRFAMFPYQDEYNQLYNNNNDAKPQCIK